MDGEDLNRESMHFRASPRTKRRAEELRFNETEAEKKLWEKLSRKQLEVKFRRQHPIFKFIADFYCHELKLVIEVDGEIHFSSESRAYDERRSSILNDLGIEVIRFKNEEVLSEMDRVLEDIRKTIAHRRDFLRGLAPSVP